MPRINYRFIYLGVLLAALAGISIAREHRPSLIASNLRLRAYVANAGDGTVSVVDLVGLSTVGTISVGPMPSGLRAHPKQKEIWGVSTQGGYVWVIDAATGTVSARIAVGGSPFAVEFSPD